MNTVSFEIISHQLGTHRVYIDEADLILVAEYRWRILRSSRGRTFYVRASTGVSLHRIILNAPKGLEVDHMDCNGLNNVRPNLRVVTTQQNQYNVPRLRNNNSGFKGVWWASDRKVWRATCGHNGRNVYIGTFDTPEEAHEAYVSAVAKLRGESATRTT